MRIKVADFIQSAHQAVTFIIRVEVTEVFKNSTGYRVKSNEGFQNSRVKFNIAYYLAAVVSGRHKVKRAPSPTELATFKLPLWASASCLAM